MAAISNFRLLASSASEPWLTVFIWPTTAASPLVGLGQAGAGHGADDRIGPVADGNAQVEETLSPSLSVRVKPALSRLFAPPRSSGWFRVKT